MLKKEMLITKAKEAKTNNEYVYIIISAKGIEVVNKPAADYTRDREEILSNPDIIKVLRPDSILKYDYSTWNFKDVSIDTMIDEINKKFIKTSGGYNK
jgi:ribosomal protein L17